MTTSLPRRLAAWLVGGAPGGAAAALYAAAMARAREPRFYAEFGVPDTLDGRFDCLAMHVMLLVRRLGRDAEGRDLVQPLYDAMFDDMDRTLREMGVGDLGVGRRVQQMGEALLGRIKAYGEGLDRSDDELLAAALARNLFGTVAAPAPGAVATIARYLRRSETSLAAQPTARLRAQGPVFAALEAVS